MSIAISSMRDSRPRLTVQHSGPRCHLPAQVKNRFASIVLRDHGRHDERGDLERTKKETHIFKSQELLPGDTFGAASALCYGKGRVRNVVSGGSCWVLQASAAEGMAELWLGWVVNILREERECEENTIYIQELNTSGQLSKAHSMSR